MGTGEDGTDAIFRRGVRYQSAGDLARAEQTYCEVLGIEPDHADAWHRLGVLAYERGRGDLAIGYIGKALQLKPRQPRYLVDLGRALRECGHREEARAAFHSAVLLSPEDAVAHFELGVVLAGLGRLDEAVEHYRAAVRLDSGLAEARANLGLLLYQSGKAEAAVAEFQSLAMLRPGDAAAHGILALALRQLGRVMEAEAPLREAVRLEPGNAEMLNALGATLIDVGRPEEAEPLLRAALRIKPAHADAASNLGLALQSLGRLEEAAEALLRAVQAQPESANIRNNLGGVLRDLGRAGEAEAVWRDAVALDPQNASAHYNLGTMLLARGEFAQGWREFEWRDRVPGHVRRRFAQPRWEGEPLGDGVLLIHAEQGFGDTIQFCRYAAEAAGRARVVLEAPGPLVRLLRGLRGVERVVAFGSGLPAFDRYCPLLSLPAIFGTTLDTIPSLAPYLAAPEGAEWEARLSRLEGARVGLCWAGSLGYSHDRWRSLRVAELMPLAHVPGISFVSLQKNPPEPAPAGLRLYDWTDELSDFADTAALIAGLDLVISADTAVAHLAGALGKPVWLLNRFDADWRWLRGREDSPWYPTLRQFRQQAPGDWAGVVRAVAAALGQVAAEGLNPLPFPRAGRG